jgi:hypothetical protein
MNFGRLAWLAATLLLLSLGSLSAQTLRYSISASRSTYFVHIERKGAGFSLVTHTEEGGRTVVRVNAVTDERLATLRYEYWNAKEDVAITAVRSDDRIEVSGTKKGRPVKVTLAIDPHPWVQSFPFGFGEFIASPETTFEYWAVSPIEFTCGLFVATKTAEEKVTVMGRETTAWKTHINMTGVLAAFWGADFWMRAADGRYLRYKGTMGLGTPEADIELLEAAD